MGCILFIPFLSVCTDDISTRAMVVVDIAVQALYIDRVMSSKTKEGT